MIKPPYLVKKRKLLCLIRVLALGTACVATGISKEWIDETNRQLKLIPNQINPSHTSILPGGAKYEKAMSLEKIEQTLGIKHIPDTNQLEEIKQIYITKAPQVA